MVGVGGRVDASDRAGVRWLEVVRLTAGRRSIVFGRCQGRSTEGSHVMGQQSIRQQARRAAMDVQSKRRRDRAERNKRLDVLAVQVLVAVRERDAAVADSERRAGHALREMTDTEGLSVRESAQWCGDGMSAREATRLRRLAQEAKSPTEPEPADESERPAGERREVPVAQGARAAVEGPTR